MVGQVVWKRSYQKIGEGVEIIFTQKDEQLETPASQMVSAGHRLHLGFSGLTPGTPSEAFVIA